MTDVRIVTVKWPDRLSTSIKVLGAWEDNPNGTHLLVPVERVMFYTKPSHAELPEVDVCPDCGGSGENPDAKQAWDIPEAPTPDCPACNGRGWVIAEGGGDE